MIGLLLGGLPHLYYDWSIIRGLPHLYYDWSIIRGLPHLYYDWSIIRGLPHNIIYIMIGLLLGGYLIYIMIGLLGGYLIYIMIGLLLGGLPHLYYGWSWRWSPRKGFPERTPGVPLCRGGWLSWSPSHTCCLLATAPRRQTHAVGRGLIHSGSGERINTVVAAGRGLILQWQQEEG